MTEIKSPLKRETSLYYRGRALVLTLHPGFVSIKQKGLRKSFTVCYDAIYELGAKMEALALRHEREAKRKMAKAMKKGKRQ